MHTVIIVEYASDIAALGNDLVNQLLFLMLSRDNRRLPQVTHIHAVETPQNLVAFVLNFHHPTSQTSSNSSASFENLRYRRAIPFRRMSSNAARANSGLAS